MTLLSDEVYRELKRRLTLWEYLPGSRIPEEAIAAEFGVSRTPVRDALRRLERDRFLEHQPWCGYRALVPNMRRMEELYEVRLALEEVAVRRVTRAADKTGLEELEARWVSVPASPDPDPELVFADEQFHESLARLSGNRSLVHHLHSINEHIRIIRVNDFGMPHRIADTYRQHRQLLEAIRSADEVLALQRLRDHVWESQANVRRAAERALTSILLDEDQAQAWPAGVEAPDGDAGSRPAGTRSGV